MKDLRPWSELSLINCSSAPMCSRSCFHSVLIEWSFRILLSKSLDRSHSSVLSNGIDLGYPGVSLKNSVIAVTGQKNIP